MSTTPAHRVEPDGEHFLGPAGSYWKHPRLSVWFCVTPTGHLGNLMKHAVTEHADGSITVSPSILISGGGEPPWHGYLERGIWRTV